MNGNGWNEHKREVLYRLENIERQLERLIEKVDHMDSGLIALKVKVGIGAAIVAVIATAITEHFLR